MKQVLTKTQLTELMYNSLINNGGCNPTEAKYYAEGIVALMPNTAFISAGNMSLELESIINALTVTWANV